MTAPTGYSSIKLAADDDDVERAKVQEEFFPHHTPTKHPPQHRVKSRFGIFARNNHDKQQKKRNVTKKNRNPQSSNCQQRKAKANEDATMFAIRAIDSTEIVAPPTSNGLEYWDQCHALQEALKGHGYMK
jgi:hypothetical protein